MKHLLVLAVLVLSLTIVSCDEQCGSEASWDDTHACKYSCTPDGVVIDCTKPGCRCYNFEQYYSEETQSCSDVNCENLNCVGRQNEAFYSCESSSRDICGCNLGTFDDCRQGCMCKDGFCRQNGVCVPRNCN
ncbi:zonadhesin-like [Chironomus tepperi]|uniref:zonadhesin-like n=1 Tax=Chironomus tepperi TaxID=113505 RepID=UPI00391FBDC9